MDMDLQIRIVAMQSAVQLRAAMPENAREDDWVMDKAREIEEYIRGPGKPSSAIQMPIGAPFRTVG